jgi:DNA-binding NtrC family response regulator
LTRRYIRRVLEESRGNVSHAATTLGIDRRSLYRMLQRYGIALREEGRQ